VRDTTPELYGELQVDEGAGMATDFTDIGFPITSHRESIPFAQRVMNEGTQHRAAGGLYVEWAPGAGVRLWVVVTPKAKFGRIDRDFVPECSTPLKITGRLPDAGQMTGYMTALADMGFPLVFSVPDYRAWDSLSLPVDARIGLVGFARGDLSAYASDEAHATETRGKPALAAEAFISSGLILPDGAPRTPPTDDAIVSGHVVATETRVNPVTGLSFIWARIETLGVTLEVVADPQHVPNQLTVGGIVSAALALSGRPIA